MVLTLTQYFDAKAVNVAGILEGTLDGGIDAAASRIGVARSDLVTEGIDGGLRVNGGLTVLDGSELNVSGCNRLTTLKITVPWEHTDELKVLAANAFAVAIANGVQLAA